MSGRLQTNGLTIKQENFCVEYIKDFNGTQAYIRAGYSPKGARQGSSELLTNTNVQRRIKELLEPKKRGAIATAKERREFLTKVMYGDIKDEVLLSTPDGIKKGEKRASVSDRIRATEALEKMETVFDEELEVENLAPIINMINGLNNEN